MASKSGGTIPPQQTIVDANQAIALLDAMHFWQVSRLNSNGQRGYELTITHAGRRIRVQRRQFVDAAIAGFAKLRGEDKTRPPFMRIAG